jgi:hypothetical protein
MTRVKHGGCDNFRPQPRRENPKRWNYTSDGKLTYAGRAGTGMSENELERLWQKLQPLAIDKMLLAEAAPLEQPIWIAARVFASALGATGDGGRSELLDVDGRWPVAAGRVSGRAGG